MRPTSDRNHSSATGNRACHRRIAPCVVVAANAVPVILIDGLYFPAHLEGAFDVFPGIPSFQEMFFLARKIPLLQVTLQALVFGAMIMIGHFEPELLIARRIGSTHECTDLLCAGRDPVIFTGNDCTSIGSDENLLHTGWDDDRSRLAEGGASRAPVQTDRGLRGTCHCDAECGDCNRKH